MDNGNLWKPSANPHLNPAVNLLPPLPMIHNHSVFTSPPEFNPPMPHHQPEFPWTTQHHHRLSTSNAYLQPEFSQPPHHHHAFNYSDDLLGNVCFTPEELQWASSRLSDNLSLEEKPKIQPPLFGQNNIAQSPPSVNAGEGLSSSMSPEVNYEGALPTTFPQPAPELAQAEAPPKKRKGNGNRWSEEEHKLFLRGLKEFKSGDWKSISRNYVITRSATQVASHAQKYYLRLKSSDGSGTTRKKRKSIHDNTIDTIDHAPTP